MAAPAAAGLARLVEGPAKEKAAGLGRLTVGLGRIDARLAAGSNGFVAGNGGLVAAWWAAEGSMAMAVAVVQE